MLVLVFVVLVFDMDMWSVTYRAPFSHCYCPHPLRSCACEQDSDVLSQFVGLQSALNTAALPSAEHIATFCSIPCFKREAISRIYVHALQTSALKGARWAAIKNTDITDCLCAAPANFKLAVSNDDYNGIKGEAKCAAVHASLTGGADGAEITASLISNGDCSGTLSTPTEDPCFPSAAVVTRADGTRARLDSVREGDAIVAATSDGALTTGTVSSLSTSKPQAEATFVKLKTTSAMEITLTPEHHLPVGDKCCSNLKKAKDVAVNERIWAVRDGAVVADTVGKKEATIDKGLHSPVLTNGAFPVVDGVVTSFDRIESVTLASYLLAYVEPVLKYTGLAALLRSSAAEVVPLDAAARSRVATSPLASCEIAK